MHVSGVVDACGYCACTKYLDQGAKHTMCGRNNCNACMACGCHACCWLLLIHGRIIMHFLLSGAAYVPDASESLNYVSCRWSPVANEYRVLEGAAQCRT